MKRTKPSRTGSGKSEKDPREVHLVIFTDLDGTLLSAEDYEPGSSLEALHTCRTLGIPVILVSSKTRSEIETIRESLGHTDPFISENGGGIYLPRDAWERPSDFLESGAYWVLPLGRPHAELSGILREAAAVCKAGVEAYSSMDLKRIRELTGLTEHAARRSQTREFDEPFLLEDASAGVLSCLESEIEKRGCGLTRGGRFYHITGGCDKGAAVRRLKLLYETIFSDVRVAAVGDAENDLPMFQEADYPFLVRRPDGGYDSAALTERVTLTQGIGPDGFYEAVLRSVPPS